MGYGGTVLHYAGEVWAPVAGMNPSDQYLDIWGTGSKDIYVVGFAWENSLLSGQGVVLHYDGTSCLVNCRAPRSPLPASGGMIQAMYSLPASRERS